jgi:site-specific DNA recombinase
MVPDINAVRSKPPRAGVYERVSKLASAKDRREIQRARSIEEQNKANREECERYGWQIADRYSDPGLSASRFATKDRPEYQRLMADVQAGKLDVVVLWEPSRGGRELEAWAQFLNACRRHQTGIYITTHGRLYDMANGRDWRSLAEDGVDSGYESEKTSVRIRRHVAATMMAGAPHGHCPYGYEREYDPKTRELIEQRPSTELARVNAENGMTKADVIRYIFRELAKGTPVSAVRRWLNEQGIPAPEGGEWGRTIIQRIAKNPVYIGKRTWRRHEGLLDANWAPLIADEETFWTVQRILNDPKRKTTRPGGVRHMLSFFATCEECGQELYVAGASKKNTHDIYRDQPGHVQIRADWLDEYLLIALAERISRKDAYPLTADSGIEAGSARTEAAELQARLDEHADLAAEGKITALSFARIEQKLLPKIAAAERRSVFLAVPPVLREVAGSEYEEVRAKIDALPVAARKELCRAVFAEIRVKPRPRVRRPRRHRGRFEVRLPVDGKDKFIGSYATMAEAIEVRNAKYIDLGIVVPEDDEATPSWRGFDPSRVTVKLRGELHAVAEEVPPA